MSFYIKQNDTVPSLRAALENGSGTAVDLTGATCQFHMRSIGATAVTVDAVSQIVDEATGIVQYNWIAADTVTVGSYQAEFEVTYPDGTIETFPNNGYIRVEITDDIT
jgi:Rib/alpha/Esp surface antigen-like repeat protein